MCLTECPFSGTRLTLPIPTRPPIFATSLKWDNQEVRRGEIVKLQGKFEGCLPNSEAAVIVYEYNPDGHHDKVTTMPTQLKNLDLEVQWEFDYYDNTAQIPIEQEKQKYQKHYVPVEYFFVVVIDGVKIGVGQESGKLRFKDAIILNAFVGPLPAANYSLTVETADGKAQTLQLDEKGECATGGLPPGRTAIKEGKPPASSGKSQSGSNDASGIMLQLASAKFRMLVPPFSEKGKIANVSTGEKVFLHLPNNTILFDAHMHIQSNNCCPLPLQWAIMARGVHESFAGAVYTPSRASVDRKDLSDQAAGFFVSKAVLGRLGKIGRLSTDLIAKVFMSKAKSTDMNKSTESVLLSEQEWEELQQHRNEQQLTAKAIQKAKLEELSSDTLEDFVDNFSTNCDFYYKHTEIMRMNIAHPMDMSFSHFWGKFGIPVYLSGKDAMYYVNDFIQLVIAATSGDHGKNITVSMDALIPRSAKEQRTGEFLGNAATSATIHLYAKALPGDVFDGEFSLKGEFRKYTDFCATRAQGTKPSEHFYIHFDGDIPNIRQLLSREYVHFSGIAPLEDDIRFEDYQVQRLRTQCAALQFPLQIFPFYHFDPRRHFDPKIATPDAIAANISASHAFFTCSVDKAEEVAFADGTVHRGALRIKPQDEFNKLDTITALLRKKMISVNDVYGDIFQHPQSKNGLFWGIKMYPRLGYAPDDFTTYKHLNNFYKTCQDNKIPITFHCSRGGMQIPDYFNFQRYVNNMAREEYDLKESDDFFADLYASPSNWENVLNAHPKLKICMAHFGGYDIWKECKGFDKLDGNPGADKHKKYLFDLWVGSIAKLVQKFENVYTDLAYFVNPDPGLFGFDFLDIAKDMVYLLTKYKDLKDRIIMGSDWYMIEQEKFKGVGAYYRKMFFMLQEVSKKVNYDAWHQFAVVNPLRFLGLIDEKKNGKGPFDIDVDKLEKYTKQFDAYWSKTKWKDGANFNGEKKQLESNIEGTLNRLRNNSKVADADSIKKDKALLILSE